MKITTKKFQFLTDVDLAWNLMLKSAMPIGENGMPAPFFEYALSSSWMDKNLLYLNRFWLDDNVPVAYVYYENPANHIFFALMPGYESLANEMIAYADRYMPKRQGKGPCRRCAFKALSDIYAHGRKYMTGGDNPFYSKIGYTEKIRWMHYKRK